MSAVRGTRHLEPYQHLYQEGNGDNGEGQRPMAPMDTDNRVLELIEKVAKLEARQEEQRKWIHGELLSVMENDRQHGEWLVRQDSLISGEDGLKWRVSQIESRWRLAWKVIAAAGGVGLTIGAGVATAVLSGIFASGTP